MKITTPKNINLSKFTIRIYQTKDNNRWGPSKSFSILAGDGDLTIYQLEDLFRLVVKATEQTSFEDIAKTLNTMAKGPQD